MFDHQTLLLQEYEKFLRAQCVWKDENITYFYQYAVGHVIRCINMVFDSRNDSEDTGVKAELFRILNNDSVIRWIQNVAWIPEDYEWLKQCVKNTDIGLAYDKLVNISRQKNMLNNEIEAGQEVHNPGKVNQKLDQILRRINSILNSQKVAKVIGSLEDDGIKITISKVRKSCRYRE